MKIRCCHLGMAVAISVLTVFSAQAENAGILKRLDRIKALADDICIITNIVVRSGVASREADPSALWKAMLEEPEKAKKAFVRVDFVLKPEKDSDIRCRAQLPFPNRWDGRMWGEGNSGHAGRIPSVDLYTKAGSAAVTTDLGTWMITDCGRTNLKIWP